MKIKWIMIILLCLAQFGFIGHKNEDKAGKKEKVLISGHFEGNEPFWDIQIRENRFVLHCNEHTVEGILNLSKKQAHSETYAFGSKKIFGVLRKSTGNCELDITEEENPTHEIYFSYRGVTYMGCGQITVQGKQ